MRVLLALIGTAAILTNLLPLASYSGEPSLTVGAGARSCAQFSQDYATSPDIMETLYFTWAQGYLTGFARASSAETNLKPSSRDDKWQMAFVREYWGAHPLSPYSEAVAALNLGLIKFHLGVK
jgi:hypothetical protein